MDVSHWMALESAMQGDQPRRGVSWATLRRIGSFARPHQRTLLWFLLLSVVSAVLTVATPVLAGRVVDAIVERQALETVIGLALLIARARHRGRRGRAGRRAGSRRGSARG